MMRGNHSLSRRNQTQAAKRKFILYSEGKNTEPDYFRQVQKIFPNSVIDIEIVPAAGTPKKISEEAINKVKNIKSKRGKKSSFQKKDQVWAIFDRDEHPYIDEAINSCKAAGVGVAFSDPCFELWLILHFQDYDRPNGRKQVQGELGKLLPSYDSKGGKTADFKELVNNKLITAEERAETQLKRREQEGTPLAPPYTTVFELTRAIKSAHEEASRSKG